MSDKAGLTALLAEFQDKAEPLGVAVLRVASAAAAATSLLQWAASLGARDLLIANTLREGAPEIVAALEEAGIRVAPPGPPEAVRDAPAGVSLATLAVAETGSVLLAEPMLADRTVSMLSLALAVVCPTHAIVPSLDEAMSELRRLALAPGSSFATLLTGPSRTADIERVLTVGVQGPGKVMILFVDDL